MDGWDGGVTYRKANGVIKARQAAARLERRPLLFRVFEAD
jgi:hypothetical protein